MGKQIKCVKCDLTVVEMFMLIVCYVTSLEAICKLTSTDYIFTHSLNTLLLDRYTNSCKIKKGIPRNKRLKSSDIKCDISVISEYISLPLLRFCVL